MLGQIETAFRAREAVRRPRRARSEERMRRFVADASHELRTPLTSIRGFAELYRQGAVPDPRTWRRIMRRIEDQATRMGLLVEDLLLLARLDQQRPLDLQPVDLLAVARATPSRTPAPWSRDRPVDVRVESRRERRPWSSATRPGCARSSATWSPTPLPTPRPGRRSP